MVGRAGAAVIPAADYRDRLAAIDARLARGDWQGAGTAAGALLGARIRYGDEELAPDRSVLGPLARARTPAAARAAAPRLRRLIAALGPAAEAAAEPPPTPAPAVLAEVQRRQALPALAKGGKLPQSSKLESFRQALREILEPPLRALAAAWERFWDWFLDFFPDDDGKPSALGWNLHTLVVVLVVATALGLAVLAWRAWRRRGGGAPEAAAASAPLPARDDDPLSRETSEWERYAAELAGAGRTREAIRAWYHAVLVALYRTGLLHYRKGRTNWEYAAALPASLPERPTFVEMTLRFEREWYGQVESSAEALERARGLAQGLLADLAGRRG